MDTIVPSSAQAARRRNGITYIVLFLLLVFLTSTIVFRMMGIGRWHADVPETIFFPIIFFVIRYSLDLIDESRTKEQKILSTAGNSAIILFFVGFATSEPIAIALTAIATASLVSGLIAARLYAAR